MACDEPEAANTSLRIIGQGEGWRVSEIICRSGPDDRPFEEAHEWVAVVPVLDGTFTYRSRHGQAVMSPGSWLLGEQHACFCCSHEHSRGDRCAAFHYAPGWFEDIAANLKGVRQTAFGRHRLPPADHLASLVDSARALCARPDTEFAEEIAFEVAAAALATAFEADEPSASAADRARIAAIVHHIDESYAQSTSLGELAALARMNRYRFLRVFRRVVGVTPYRYILYRRLEAAAEHLRESDGSVAQVALECGFGDISEFARRFRRAFRCAPGRYRRSFVGARGG